MDFNYTDGKVWKVQNSSNPPKILFIKPCTSIVQHEEADITLISYMLQAVETGAPIVRILSDDTDVFVLLVYWV